jgi:hypothetical protein
MDRHSKDLRAAALPRIGVGCDSLGRGASAAREPWSAAEPLLDRLAESALARLPWTLGPSGHWVAWGLRLGAATFITFLALRSWNLPVLWSACIPAAFLVWGWASLVRHQDARRRAQKLRRELSDHHAVATIDEELAQYLRVVPDDPAGRYLLALARVQRSRPLEALLQLATLRDRYPSVGEIVLLGAIACAQLHRPRQAGRLLSALSMDREHPWWNEVVDFAHACGSLGPEWSDGVARSGAPS